MSLTKEQRERLEYVVRNAKHGTILNADDATAALVTIDEQAAELELTRKTLGWHVTEFLTQATVHRAWSRRWKALAYKGLDAVARRLNADGVYMERESLRAENKRLRAMMSVACKCFAFTPAAPELERDLSPRTFQARLDSDSTLAAAAIAAGEWKATPAAPEADPVLDRISALVDERDEAVALLRAIVDPDVGLYGLKDAQKFLSKKNEIKIQK